MKDSGVERQSRLTGAENEPDFNGRQQSRILVIGRKPEPATPKTDEGICRKGRNSMRRMTLVEEKSRLMIVPADAVRQRRQVLFIRTRCKGQVGGDRIDLAESDRKRVMKVEVTRSLECERGIRNDIGTSEMG
jgi:hypothetical protein